MQNARENPLAAVAAAAAVSGSISASQNNAENLLDIDFDGAAPASTQKEPASGIADLEGLAGTPQRVASPAVTGGAAPSAGKNDLDDLAGVFGNGFALQNGAEGVMNGFADLDLSGGRQPPPPEQQLGAGQSAGAGKKTDEDLLGLF